MDKETLQSGESNTPVIEIHEDSFRFRVPRESDFEEQEADFLPAPELREIGQKLIAEYEGDFPFLHTATITYLWKKKGGKSGGKDTLGKCQRPSGLLKHFSEVDFVVWLGADNCAHFSRKQIKALVFHELKHAGYDIEKGEYATVSHDFEGFAREVEVFGDWRSDIVRMRRAFQGELFQQEAA
jgi:hypothetical protein